MTAVAVVDHEGPSKLTLLRPIAKPADVLAAQNETREFVAKALTQGRDYGVIPGTAKPSLLQPGAERVAIAFGCYFGQPEIVMSEIDHDRVVRWVKRKKVWSTVKGRRTFEWETTQGESIGLYRYVVRVSVIDRSTGLTVGSGLGMCSTMEPKYVEDPRSAENTVLLMAYKRAIVRGARGTFGLSDEFTQDVEEFDQEPQPPTRPAPMDLTNDHGPDRRDTPHMTSLERACAVRVRGRPLGELRNTGLREIYEWANNEMNEKGEDERLINIAEACKVIIDAREAGTLTEPPKKEKPAKEPKAEKGAKGDYEAGGPLPFENA